jgi:hypothetical protein
MRLLDYSRVPTLRSQRVHTLMGVHDHSGVLFCSRLRGEPVVLRYSMFCLPPTLRAVQRR